MDVSCGCACQLVDEVEPPLGARDLDGLVESRPHRLLLERVRDVQTDLPRVLQRVEGAVDLVRGPEHVEDLHAVPSRTVAAVRRPGLLRATAAPRHEVARLLHEDRDEGVLEGPDQEALLLAMYLVAGLGVEDSAREAVTWADTASRHSRLEEVHQVDNHFFL